MHRCIQTQMPPGPQDLMRDAPALSNVVEACNLEGRQERLDALLGQLELCEKALQARFRARAPRHARRPPRTPNPGQP